MNFHKKEILLVEDSRFFGRVLKNGIELHLDFKVHWALTYAEASKIIDKNHENLFLSLLDLNLPDAPQGEIVDHVLSCQIPAIVFTANVSDDERELIWQKGVVDYVLKEGHHNIEYIIGLVWRIHRNRHIKVLIVDDSRVSRHHLKTALKIHQYQIIEAGNSHEALDQLKQHPDIKLMITDYHMPDKDGAELTKIVRESHAMKDLTIIGMSGHASHMLSARFMKCGANDFMHKPFVNEELYCRMNQNLTIMEYIHQIEEFSFKDYLTGLYNRRYFYDTAEKIISRAQRRHDNLALALFDIDHFKAINDQFGHDRGDMVLKEIATVLTQRFRKSDIVARIGGEEFCVLTVGLDPDCAFMLFDQVRTMIEQIKIETDSLTIQCTVSIGVAVYAGQSLEALVKQADTLLYQAKNEGRNRVRVKADAPCPITG